MTPPSAAPPRPRSSAWLAVAGLVAVTAAYVALAAFHVANGALNVDEGFYAAATRAVWQGELPYRDFGFTQTPLVLYANAAPLGLTRFGLFEQRILNGVWGALALLLAARLVTRRAGVGWAVWFVALFALCPAWLYFIHLGKTYGLVSLLVMAMTTVFLDAKPGTKKSVALSVLAILGVGARLPAAPFFAVLWLAVVFEGARPSPRRVLVAVVSLTATAALFSLPFYLAAPEQSVFWTVDFHHISVPKKDWRLRWDELVALAPALWLLAALALGFVGAAVRRRWRQPEVAVLAAAALALAANLLPRGVYEEYGVPFLPRSPSPRSCCSHPRSPPPRAGRQFLSPPPFSSRRSRSSPPSAGPTSPRCSAGFLHSGCRPTSAPTISRSCKTSAVPAPPSSACCPPASPSSARASSSPSRPTGPFRARCA